MRAFSFWQVGVTRRIAPEVRAKRDRLWQEIQSHLSSGSLFVDRSVVPSVPVLRPAWECWPPRQLAGRIPDCDHMQLPTLEEATMALKFLNQHSSSRGLDHDVVSTRRALLLASLFASLQAAFSEKMAFASEINPSETVITLPDAIHFVPWSSAPAHSGEMATLYGGLDQPGPYLVLMKWYPGFMSAPHFLCDRSAVDGAIWHVVGEKRSRFRSGSHGSGSGRRFRQAGCSYAALPWRKE